LPVELRKKIRAKRDRHAMQVKLALEDWEIFLKELGETANTA